MRYDTRFAWAAFAAAHGMSADARRALVETVDSAIGQVDGVGFRVTPFARSDALSDQLGFSRAGGVWVKDETHNVAGSHKARHLMSVLLHLLAAESLGHARRASAARDRLVWQRRARRSDAGRGRRRGRSTCSSPPG